MRSDIDKGPAALLVLIDKYAPCRNRTAANCDSLGVVNVSEGTVFRFLFKIKHLGSVTVLITDAELLAGALSRIKHLLCFLRVDCHRLLAHYMLACLESVNGDKAVRTVGRAHMNNVDGLVLEKLLIVRIYLRVLGTVVLCCLLCLLLNDVAECNHFHILDRSESGHMLTVCDTAASDNTDSYCIICRNCHDYLQVMFVRTFLFPIILK